jgi:hypothetical protein
LEFEKAAQLRDQLRKLKAAFYGAEVNDIWYPSYCLITIKKPCSFSSKAFL